MIVFKDYNSFNILGEEVIIISDPTSSYMINTVAEINNQYYYLGDKFPTISAAIFAWQQFYDIDLTNEELQQIMNDNKNKPGYFNQ